MIIHHKSNFSFYNGCYSVGFCWYLYSQHGVKEIQIFANRGLQGTLPPLYISICNDDIFLLKFDHSTRSVAVRKYTVAVPKYTLPILNPQSKELSLLYTHMSKLSSVFLFFFTFYTIKSVFLHILLDKFTIRCIIVYIGHSSIQNFTIF